ncbi:MAG: hypothetical protein ACI4EV_08930 [Lachnospiraceae bacterium]
METANKNGKYTVGGYTFATQELAQAARDEINAIKYVSSKTNTNDPAQVYVLYNKMIEKKLFKTPVGMDYLKELQRVLYVSKEIPNDRIRPIPVETQIVEALEERQTERNNRDRIRDLEKSSQRNHDRFIKSMILNIFLVIAVIAMVLITLSSSNPNIIDYENKLIDKYEEWNNQLESKERKLNDLQKELESKYNINID